MIHVKNKTIITISREFGSGGRELGELLAKILDIPFYDKEIIEISAKESGIDQSLFEEKKNQTSKGIKLIGALGYSLGGPLSTIGEITLNDRLFLVQSQVISQLASKGACVMIGRCADYILQDHENVLNIFVYADMKDRIQRAIHSYEVNEDDIENSILKIDKQRANYYNYYSDRTWGRIHNYDLCLNTSTFSIIECAEIIKHVLKKDAI